MLAKAKVIAVQNLMGGWHVMRKGKEQKKNRERDRDDRQIRERTKGWGQNGGIRLIG